MASASSSDAPGAMTEDQSGAASSGEAGGLERQTEIYLGGVSGLRPRVPLDAERAEARARRARSVGPRPARVSSIERAWEL